MKLTENQKRAIIDFFNDYDLSISSHDACHAVETQLEENDLPEDLDLALHDLSKDVRDFAEGVKDQLIEMVREDSIIYYDRAIKYLQENDPSLCQSMAIASEYGLKPSDLDSEKLANMLSQEIEIEKIQNIDFYEIFDIIKNN